MYLFSEKNKKQNHQKIFNINNIEPTEKKYTSNKSKNYFVCQSENTNWEKNELLLIQSLSKAANYYQGIEDSHISLYLMDNCKFLYNSETINQLILQISENKDTELLKNELISFYKKKSPSIIFWIKILPNPLI